MKLETGHFKKGILISLIGLNAFGFEATMTIQPPLIELSGSAVLSIEVRDAKNPQPPALPNVPGLKISYSGQSTQHSWVNGKSDSFTAFNFQVYPQQTGTFAIGPFVYGTQTLQGEIKVVAGSAESQQPQSWSDLLFAKLEMDRDSAYVQEPFGLTLSIYSRQGVQLAGNINLQGMPETGLDGLQWQEGAADQKVFNNAVYNVRQFHARTRAMSSGEFNFNPVVTVQVATQSQQQNRDPFFGSMFQRTETRPVDLPVQKTSITVNPLPADNKPAGFNGAVGRFDFQVQAQPLKVHPGDPITLTMRISGDGNFDRVMTPEIPFDETFRLFGDPVRKQTDQGVTFEQVISPRTAETHEIPPVLFSFFDTGSGTYRTVHSAPIPITVTASANSTAQVFAAKETVVMSPPEEHPFATESDVQRAAQWFSKVWKNIRPWLWTLPAALIAGLAAFFGRKLAHVRKRDAARIRRQKAPKAARKALHTASQARKQGDSDSFHNALWEALTGYFGHRLNLPPGEVTSAVTLQALDRSTVDPEQLNNLWSIFNQLEARRYGLPGADSSSEAMIELQSTLERVLRYFEKVKY